MSRLIDERLEVDWVMDGEDPRWEAGDMEDHADDLREFQRLNQELYSIMQEASQKFQVFLEAADSELAPYGLGVRVHEPQLLSEDPEEWVGPEFFLAVAVEDVKSDYFLQPTEGFLRFRVDVRLPVTVTETIHDVSFMAYSDRDKQLTPGNMLIQALYPSTHLEVEGFEDWRATRLDMIND